MKKKQSLSEVRKMQKIAGLLKEDNFDLSNTPQFKGKPRTVEQFLKNEDFIQWLIDIIRPNLDGGEIDELIFNCIIKNREYEDFEEDWERYQEDLGG